MSKNPDKGTDFIFRLSGIELPSDVTERIAGEIRATVMRELAKTDLRGGTKGSTKLTAASGRGGAGVLIPVGWNGGWWVIGPTLRDAVARFDKVGFEIKEFSF